MAPPKLSSSSSAAAASSSSDQNRRTSRRPPRYSPGGAAEREAQQQNDEDEELPDTSSPPGNSRTTRSKSIHGATVPTRNDGVADDVVARLKRDFATLATVTIPESEFSLPDDLLTPKMPAKKQKRGKSKAKETPPERKTPAAKASGGRGRGAGKRSAGAFSTPKLPTDGGAHEVVLSPAAKRQRTVPAKYRTSPDVEPHRRTIRSDFGRGMRSGSGTRNRFKSGSLLDPSNTYREDSPNAVTTFGMFDPVAANAECGSSVYCTDMPPMDPELLRPDIGPPIPFKGKTRDQSARIHPLPLGLRGKNLQELGFPADFHPPQTSGDEDEDSDDDDDDEEAFMHRIASDPLPFELDGDEYVPPTPKSRGRKSATNVPAARSPKKGAKAKAGPKKEAAKKEAPKKETPKKEPATKPPRKAPTNITPKRGPGSKKKEPAPEPKEEPEAPVEEAEPEPEPVKEPEKPKTPKRRGPVPKALRQAKSEPQPQPEPEPVPIVPVVAATPEPAAASASESTPQSATGRPQRARKIPAKFSEDVIFETAVVSSSVPETRKSRTKTPRRSISIATESAAKRESISEAGLKEEIKTEAAEDPMAAPEEPASVVDQEEPVEEASVQPEAEETPVETINEPTEDAEPVVEDETPTVTQETVEEKPEEMIEHAEDVIKPEPQPEAPMEAAPTPAADIPSTSNNSNVRSSGRIRKKPQDRDFFPGHSYTRREGTRKSFQKSSESEDFDIDPSLLAEILSHTAKLEKTISSPKAAAVEAAVAIEEAVVGGPAEASPEPVGLKSLKRKRTGSDVSVASESTEIKPKPKKGPKRQLETVFKTPLPPKPRVPRKSSSIDSPLPVEVKVEPIVIPTTPSTPMNFPMPLAAPQLDVKSYSQPQEFFEVAPWNSKEYSDYLEYIEERQKANSQSVGLGFLRETLPATEDYFYREVLRSGGDVERVDSSPIKRGSGDRVDLDVVTTEELPGKDTMTADPAERIAKDIVDFVPRPIKVPEVPEGEYVKTEDEDLTWTIEDAKKLATEHDNPRFSRLLNDVINVISSQFVSFMSSFGTTGGPAIYYSHSVENGRRLGHLLHRCIGDEQNFPNQIHEWMIRNLPLEFLARYLDIVRFLAEANKQTDLIMRMMAIGTDVMVNSCHNWVLEFTMAQTSDPHNDLVKHSLKTVQLPDCVFVIVHPNISRASAATKAHISMFRDLLPGIADHVDVKLQFPSDLRHPYEIMCYCVDTVIQEVQDTIRRFPEQHVVVAAWGVACRIVQKALQDVAGVSATLMFAYPNESIQADPDDEANLTYCPTLFVGGEKSSAHYIERLQLTRRYMIADTGLVVVVNADRNLLVSATRLGIERLSQRTVDRAIVEHAYDFLKMIMKNANANLKVHRREMAPLNMAELMEASNTTIEDHKIKKTLFQSPSTARSSASRNQAK